VTPAERLAAHEAGHAVACVVLGVPVRLIDVVGDAKSLGYVLHGLSDGVSSEDDARKRMLIILCGQIEGAEEWDELPAWPLRTHASTDEANLHALADYLELDERSYDDVRFDALKLTLDREYQMLHTAVTGMLAYQPRIGPELIGRLVGIARRD
jgi:hypothetical protein